MFNKLLQIVFAEITLHLFYISNVNNLVKIQINGRKMIRFHHYKISMYSKNVDLVQLLFKMFIPYQQKLNGRLKISFAIFHGLDNA